MRKPKVISIGGYEHKIPAILQEKLDFYHLPEPGQVLPKSFCPTAKMIVVIARFSSRGSNVARLSAASRGDIPVIISQGWNYLTEEIKASDKIPDIKALFADEVIVAKEKENPVAVPKVPAVATEKELWEAYETLLSESIGKVFVPGEKMDISEFLPIVAEDVGISEADVTKMLPYLAVSGVIDNPVGTTWRLVGPEGYTVDLEPAKKPEKEQASHVLKLARLVKGLGPGPFPYMNSIEMEMMLRKEFVTSYGTPISRTMAYNIAKAAKDEGFIFHQGGAFYVVPDETVKLTPVVMNALPAPKKVAATNMPVQDLRELKISDDLKFLRSVVGIVELPRLHWAILLGVKSLIPKAHWNKFSDVTIMRVLRTKGVSPRPIPMEMFTSSEWDALAWEAVREFKIEALAPHFNVSYYDEELQCADCREMFMFTKSEKKFYFEKEISDPRQCPGCRSRK